MGRLSSIGGALVCWVSAILLVGALLFLALCGAAWLVLG